MQPVKTFLLFVLLLASFPLTLFAEQKPDLKLSDEEKAWVRAHPSLTVANEMDWPPFDF